MNCKLLGALVKAGGRTEDCDELSGGIVKAYVCQLQNISVQNFQMVEKTNLAESETSSALYMDTLDSKTF